MKENQNDIIVKNRVAQNIYDNRVQQPERGVPMLATAEENQFYDPNGQGESYMGPPPVQQNVNQTGVTTMKSLLKIPTNITPQTTMNSQQLKQQISRAGAHTKNLSVGGKQVTLKTINTGISDIKHQATTKPLARLATIQSAGPSRTQISNHTMVEEVAIEAKREKPIQYVKIGDKILLTVKIQIFSPDIEQQTMKETAAAQGELYYEEMEKKIFSDKTKQINMRLTKLIDDPVFIYKGVLYCEGLNNFNIQTLPKRTPEDTQNAMSQFTKCTFIVEPAWTIEKLVAKRMIEKEVANVKDTREQFFVLGDHQQVAKIDKKLQELQEQMNKILNELEIERSINGHLVRKSQGKKIQYGEAVQLRHEFTGMYLSIVQSEMSNDHGAIKVQIGELTQNSLFQFIPCQNEHEFRSEMFLNVRDAKKFNFASIGNVNAREAFYLLNTQPVSQVSNQCTVVKQNYYIHVDRLKIAQADGQNSILEVNASLNPTKIIAKIFDSSNSDDSKRLKSGDVVRILHLDSGCYMQADPQFSGNRNFFPPYPDFLQAEINALKQEVEGWEGDFQNAENSNQEDSFDLDNSQNNQDKKNEEAADQAAKTKNIYLETESRRQSFTDSCWEIQMMDSFVGGIVDFGQQVRFKHVVTDSYLALDSEQLFLNLKKDPVQQPSSIFTINKPSDDSPQLNNNSQLYLGTMASTLVQVYQDSKDEVEKLFDYTDFSPHEFYNTIEKKTALNLVAGKQQPKGGEQAQKMIFKIVKVEPRLAKIAFECNSILQMMEKYYKFLNTWAIIKDENAEAMHEFVYDCDTAIHQEDQLSVETIKIITVIKQVQKNLQKLAGEDEKHFQELQRHLCEQRMLDCVMYLLELIYYKTVPPEYRSKPFQPERFLKFKVFDLSSENYLCYQIAKDHLDTLNLLLLNTLYLIIKKNKPNCERVTKFTDILFLQFRRQPNSYEQQTESIITSKIFTHVYKTADYIFNDRAAVIKSEEGVCQHLPEAFTNLHQVTRWLGLLETIQCQDLVNNNLKQQARYIKIIASFCRSPDPSKYKYIYQLQIIQRLFYFEENIPLWFGSQRRADKSMRPYFYFARLQQETVDQFLGMNPTISSCYSQSLNQEGDRNFDIVFDISELTLRHEEMSSILDLYFDYVQRVCQLYTALVGGRNREATTIVRERIGASEQVLLSLCAHSDRQTIFTIQHIKPAFLNLLSAIVLKWQPFEVWTPVKNRVFFWHKLDESEPYNMIYEWEKIKGSEDKTNTYGNQEDEIINMALLIRQVLDDFLEKGPSQISEFLYSSEKKTYTPELVNPVISQISQYMDVIIDCLKSESCDTVFVQKVLDFSTMVLLAVSNKKFIGLFQEYWIYKLMRVVQRVPDSHKKLQKLVKKTLQCLDLICHHRLTMQLLTFLKLFKDFEETNYFSHIGFDSKQMDSMFKNIFQLQQFNIDVKSLQLLYLLLNPKQRIILDADDEKAAEADRIKRQEERATMLKKRSIKSAVGSDFDSQGNIADMTYVQTLRSNISQSKMMSDRSSSLRKKKTMTAEEEEEHQKLIQENIQPTDSEKKDAQTNRDLPIDEYLLYFVFLRTEDSEIPEDAIEIIKRSVRQKDLLMEEACKVQLVVSDNDFENYKMIRFLKDRLSQVVTRLNQEEYTFLLYRLGQQEQIRQKISDLNNVFKQLSKIIYSCEDEVQRSKIQNFALQVDFCDLLINQLLKQVYYDRQTHKKMFDFAMDFLFWFSYNNRDCQQALKPHLAYIAHLLEIDIRGAQVLAQIIQSDKLNVFGMKFHQFIVRKVTVQKNYRPQIFDYMRFVIQGEPTLQCYFLSQVVADSSFRFRIYMNTGTAKEKIEIIQEMVRKRLIFGKQDNAEVELAADIMKVNLHVSIIQFISTCAENNIYGVRQIRRLVELESLMDALLAQSVPYQIKKYYFRLFYVGFVQQIGDLDIIDIAFPRFLQMLRYVCLYDLEEFHKFFEGLIITHPVGMGEEAMNDPEFKRLKIRILQELEQQTQEIQDRLTSRKTFKQMNEEKEVRQSLSPLNQSRPFPFLEEKNYIEYWQYLCSIDKETGKPEGLLIFISDLYRVLIQKRPFWSEELKVITAKLYEILMQIIDKLHQLADTYMTNLIETDDLQFALSEAILNIPMDSVDKKGDHNRTANTDQDDDQLDEDIKEKILRYTRDHIISKNLTIRNAFGIETLKQDINVHPYFIKHKLKEICGQDVGFKEIEMLVRKLIVLTRKKQQLAAVVGVQLGQPGHIRTRYSANLHLMHTAKYRKEQIFKYVDENPEDQFNFRELEVLIKNALSKAGFKAPIIRRERITADLMKDEQGNPVKDEFGKEIELPFEMKMEQDDLSKGTQIDYQHFIKCYWEFLERYKNVDDINDLAKKILQKFSIVFILGTKQRSQSIDLKEYNPLKIFLRNIIRCIKLENEGSDYIDAEKLQVMAYDYFKMPKTKINTTNKFLIELLTKMLTQLQIQNYEPEIQSAAIMRLTSLQRICVQQGVIGLSLKAISPVHPEVVVTQSFRLLNAIIQNNNPYIVEQFYNTVKDHSYMMLCMIRTRINYCIDRLLDRYIQLPPKYQKGRIAALQSEKNFVKDPDLVSQPFYVPEGFNLGNKLKDKQEHTELQELLQTLDFIRNLCREGSEFPKLFRVQESSEQVNIVHCVGEALITITQRLKQLIYTDFTAYTCLEQLFLTLELISYGQEETKSQFANWRSLQRVLNFYIQQDFVYFSADSAFSRQKIKLMFYALRLISSCIETESNMSSVIVEVSLQQLKAQLISIFKFRIGGTPHRQHAFKTNKLCTHDKKLCTPNEYCFFEDIVSFDLQTIECAFLIFQILMQANKLLPAQVLGNIRFNRDTGNLFLQNKKKYIGKIYWESFERIQEVLQEIQRQKVLSNAEEASELNDLLEEIFIGMNEQKIERRFFKTKAEEEKSDEKDFTIGIDSKKKLKDKDALKLAREDPKNQNPYLRDEEEDYEFEERFLEIIGKAMKQPNPFKRLCCRKVGRSDPAIVKTLKNIFCFPYLYKLRRNKSSFTKASEKIRELIKDRRDATDAKTKIRIDQYITTRQVEVQRKRIFLGPFTGSLTKQILESTTYVFDQFKYDYVYRFMLNQMSTVEVVHNGKIVSEMFPIPTYCNFISLSDQQQIALELTSKYMTDSHAKIEKFLLNMPKYKAKMKQNQRIARISPILYRLTELTPIVKKIIFAVTLLVNLMICYAYTYKYEQPKLVYIYDPRDWLREAVNIQDFIPPVLRKPPPIDPWAIKLKQSFFAYPIDYLPVLNAAFSIFNFILELCTFDGYLDQNSGEGGAIQEEMFTTASLATQLPSRYLRQEQGTTKKQLADRVYSLLINKTQQNNLLIVLMMISGLVFGTYMEPIILVYLVFSQLEIVKSFMRILYKNVGQLLALICIDVLVFYLLGYISFIQRNCLEVTECITQQLEQLFNLQEAPVFELIVVFVFGLLTFNLFFGLVMDSISEIRQSKHALEQLIQQKCFICDLTKADFEAIKENFDQHLKEQHNVMAYIYYLLWLSDSELPSGNVSRNVKAQVEKGSINFIPYRNCKLMQKE